jgi:hypothetical protein
MTGPLLKKIAASILGVVLAQGAWSGPRLQVDSPLWDFGRRTNVLELTHDYSIRNAGDSDLSIVRLVSSCNVCLHAALNTNLLSPGASAVVHARLDLSLANGPIEREIALYSNDPDNSRTVLSLAGVAIPAYQVEPVTLILDPSLGPAGVTGEITPLFKPRASLSRVECDDTNLTVTLSPQASGGFKVSVRANASLPRGRFLFHLTARSADTNDYPCQIKGIVNNPPDLEIIPDRLQFEEQDGPQERILWIRQRGPAPLVLLDIVPTSDKIHCEIDPDPSGCDYKVYVTAWQQKGEQGRTNRLAVKLQDVSRKEQSVMVPVLVGRSGAPAP